MKWDEPGLKEVAFKHIVDSFINGYSQIANYISASKNNSSYDGPLLVFNGHLV